MNTTLTETPQEITGLAVGTKYLFQNKSVADAYLHEGPTMPTADNDDTYLLAGRGVGKVNEVPFDLKGNNSLFGWTSGGEAKIFWNELA